MVAVLSVSDSITHSNPLPYILCQAGWGYTVKCALDKRWVFSYNKQAIGVWRSLVSRLVRVQEASGSNPDTPTIKEPTFVFRQVWVLFDKVNSLISLEKTPQEASVC